MARLLFFTWYGAGNQVPSIGLARELRNRGHEVVFAGYRGQGPTFAGLGFEFVTLPRADARYAEAAANGNVLAALGAGVWACGDHLNDVPELIASTGCDGVLVDCLMLSVLAALEGTGVPVAVVVHSTPGALAPPGGDLERRLLGPLNDVRAAAGRPALGRVWDAWAPFTTLVTSIVELDPLAADVPRSFEFVGPISDGAEPSGWTPPWPTGDTRPLAVVSFTTGAWDQRSRIQRALAALAGDDYRVLALTGAADIAGLDVPGNAMLCPYVPHAEVLGGAAVTINHAGHGTVGASLAHGVPMVCLPNPVADQPALAAQVERLGAGIALDGERATATEIANAVRTVTSDGAYRVRAAELADRIAAAPGARGSAEIIEATVPAARRS